MVILVRGAFVIGLLILWVWSVFDVIRTEETPRYLHKLIWLAFVVLFSPIGALAWLFLGRPQPFGSRWISPPPPSAPPPDDSPEYLRRVDEEIRRRRRAEQLRGAREEIDQERIDDELRRFEEEFKKDDGGEDAAR
jgi:hypothetical protein